MSWKLHLTDQEVLRLAELASEREANKAECRRIYDRCRKRMKARTNKAMGNDRGNEF